MERNIMWTPWTEPGLEHLHLSQNNEGIFVDSLIIGVKDNKPFRTWYEIRCDTDWRVQELGLVLLSRKDKGIKLRVDEESHWTSASGEPISSLDSCIDVDISATPFTNTLPIRRLKLSPGQFADLLVAYVAVPQMELKPVRQRYTCLEASTDGWLYRYESLTSGFTTELQVDSDGLVIDYPGLFKRVWQSPYGLT